MVEVSEVGGSSTRAAEFEVTKTKRKVENVKNKGKEVQISETGKRKRKVVAGEKQKEAPRGKSQKRTPGGGGGGGNKAALNYRCSPKEILSHVKPPLSDGMVQLIKQLGVDFVFLMKMKHQDNELIKFIISRWDGKNKCIKLDDGKNICITEEDVYRVYGLPRRPNVVSLLKTSKDNSKLAKNYGFSKTGKGTVAFDNLRTCMGAEKSDDSRW
ncbi:unnamed protein product [Linum trigynum]|uniref:Uncharacterized protein n=1 Tax=Linum trigynum TaxID=586398 RepID=A0AAV2G8U2_9ROSI